MQKADVAFTSRHIDADGVFTGYGAIFGNLDSHGDIIEPGAFRETLSEWRSKGRWPAMKLMHGASGQPFTNDDLPIGRWLEMREDSNGLFVKGQLLALNTDYGRRIHALMAAGLVLDGLSIGYRVKRSSPGRGAVKRVIEAVSLIEVSVVDVPSNDLARVASSGSGQAALDDAYGRLQQALAAVAEEPADPLAARIRALARS